MLMANNSRNVPAIAFVTRIVVLADWAFTTPSVVIQPITGLILVQLAGIPMNAGWLMAAMALYVFAGVCWVPVVAMQMKMRDMAATALANNEPLPEAYWDLSRWWILLGSAAFPAVMVIFYLMVFTPQ